MRLTRARWVATLATLSPLPMSGLALLPDLTWAITALTAGLAMSGLAVYLARKP